MKRILASIYFTITCAFSIDAQVIDYEIDSSFNSFLTLNSGGVSDLLVLDDGRVMVTGMLYNFGSPAGRTSLLSPDGDFLMTISTASYHRLGKYLNGFIHYGISGVQRFNIPPNSPPDYYYEFAKPAYSHPLNDRVLDAMALPDDNLLIAGRFFTDSTLSGTPISSQGLRQLCMIDSTGAPVPGFNMLRCAQPVDAEIYSIKKLSTGKYIITGRFSEVEGHATNSMARLNEDFSVDTTFVSPLVYMKLVTIKYLDSQDRIWTYIEHGVLNTNPSETIWGARFLPNGEVDPAFNIPVMFAQVTANPPSNNGTFPTFIGGMFEDSDGTFIITGDFTLYNGISRKGIAKIYDDGTLVPGVFENLGADEADWNSYTRHPGCNIHPLPDGKLMISGRFSSFGGEPYSCLVRLQSSGFVGMAALEGRGELKIWPNPVGFGSAQPPDALVNIALPDANEHIERVEMYDMQGRIVSLAIQFDKSQAHIDVQGVVSGIYVIKAGSSKGVYTQKLVVQ